MPHAVHTSALTETEKDICITNILQELNSARSELFMVKDKLEQIGKYAPVIEYAELEIMSVSLSDKVNFLNLKCIEWLMSQPSSPILH